MPTSLSSRETPTNVPPPKGTGVMAEGWLIKAREHGIRFPILKSKWARHYFVLRSLSNRAFALDEYRSDDRRRLRKTYNMDQCIQTDSYLQISDPSCTAARGMQLQWIFSIHFSKPDSTKRSELYLVAESEQEMLEWVSAICRACNLEKQDETLDQPKEKEQSRLRRIEPIPRDERSSFLSSSLAGMSMSSNVSTSESTQDHHNSRSKESKDYMHINKFHTRQTPRTTRTQSGVGRALDKKKDENNWKSEGSSACSRSSSLSSSRRSLTDDEEGSSSCVSSSPSNGKDLPPVDTTSSTRSQLSSTTTPSSLRHEITVNTLQNQLYTNRLRLNQPVPPPPPNTVIEGAENESSGETIKILGKRKSELKAQQFSPPKQISYVNARSISTSNPPPPFVDRSSKPSRLFSQSDDDRSSLDGSKRNFRHLPALPKTTPRRGARAYHEAPKSAGLVSPPRSSLEYFDPVVTRSARGESFSGRSHFSHSPVPASHEIDYIRIDAQKTQAVKQLIAQRGAAFDE
ncbi:unnamed protein product, partial [Mesorhabditis belari]|uniref:PH domain-containing protein n=1 Tax=Mesorhabditis belari TaxID=2138241 RepID=A0AAF3FE06_9BILA